MITFLNSDTFWLVVTNLLVGLVTLSCLLAIGISILKELRQRAKQKKEESQVPRDYLTGLKDLGVTLPNGGKRIDEVNQRE